MHPLDTNDRRDLLQARAGLGMCNITKCCTEVCPERIRITDNAIIPLKERVVDVRYDPIVWVRAEDPAAQERHPSLIDRTPRAQLGTTRGRQEILPIWAFAAGWPLRIPNDGAVITL
jgi:hypothetical protein